MTDEVQTEARDIEVRVMLNATEAEQIIAWATQHGHFELESAIRYIVFLGLQSENPGQPLSLV